MQPFYTSPQSYTPLSLQMQDALALPQTMDPFASLGAEDFLPLPDQTAPDVSVPAAAPDPELNWRQRLANRLAGPLSGASSQEDRDFAMRRGMGELGQQLLLAALAPDARRRALALSTALPRAQESFRKELSGAIEFRDQQEQREYQRTQREREGERYGYEKGQRERSLAEQGREDAASQALAGQIGEWRSQFERYITDKDVNENKRGELSAMFNSAMTMMEKNPSPEAADKVLMALRAAANEANEEEDLMEEIGQEHLKEAAKRGMTAEEYAKFLSEKTSAELRGFHLSSIQLAEARANQAENAAERELSRRLRELQAGALDDLMAGTPKTLPDGTIVVPDSPGLSFLRPPRSSATSEQAKVIRELMRNPDVALWMSDPSSGIPQSAKLALSGLGVKTPQDLDALVEDLLKGGASGASGPPEGANPVVVVTGAQIEKKMQELGLDRASAMRAIQEEGARRNKIVRFE